MVFILKFWISVVKVVGVEINLLLLVLLVFNKYILLFGLVDKWCVNMFLVELLLIII